MADALLDMINDDDWDPISQLECYGPYQGVPNRPNFQVLHEMDIEELWSRLNIAYERDETEHKENHRHRANSVILIE